MNKKHMKRRFAWVWAAVLLILTATACSGKDKTSEEIKLSDGTLEIPCYTQKSVTILNYDSSWKNFKVISSDDDIAVDSSTLSGGEARLPEVSIQAFGEGEATMTFSADDLKSATLKVVVTPNY